MCIMIIIKGFLFGHTVDENIGMKTILKDTNNALTNVFLIFK